MLAQPLSGRLDSRYVCASGDYDTTECTEYGVLRISNHLDLCEAFIEKSYPESSLYFLVHHSSSG